MLARIWKGCVLTSKSDEFQKFVNETGAKDCSAAQGSKGVMVLRNADGDETEFTFISFWESVDAMNSFFGYSEKGKLYPNEEKYLLSSTEKVIISEALFYQPKAAL